MRAALFVSVLLGCSAQFDFDTQPLDAAPNDAALPEAAEDVGTTDRVVPPDALRPGKIVCGTSVCSLPIRACCIADMRSVCIEPTEVVCGGVLVRCDSSNDCAPGHVCCAALTDAGLTSAQCRDTQNCTGPGNVVLCDPDDPSECASCGPAAPPLPAGYHQCF